MSRMSDLINGYLPEGQRKMSFVKKTQKNDEDTEFDDIIEKLKSYVENNLDKFVDELGNELATTDDKLCKATDDINENTSKEFEERANKAGWSCKPTSDMVNSPSHYKGHKFEVIDIIEDFDLNFNKANCLKYLLRAGKKNTDSYIQDLEKAIWYLNREIRNYKLTFTEMSK